MGIEFKGRQFVKFCKHIAIKDDEVLHEFNDVDVKGLNVFQQNFI